MGIENLAEDLLNEPDDGKEKAPGRIADDIIEGQRIIDDEIHELQLRVRESKDAKLENARELEKELGLAQKERKEWGDFLELASAKRMPTGAERKRLEKARVEALRKATAAAQSAGVKLDDVLERLREAERAVLDYEPLDVSQMQTTDFQTEGLKLRERERLLREAGWWLKKATIIQSLIETGAKRVYS